jgi:hypothetical protein
MLLQSRDGILRLFPWLPGGTRRASFVRLRAVGAFIVSANYSHEVSSTTGRVDSPVIVHSEAGSPVIMEQLIGWDESTTGQRVVVCRGRVTINVTHSVDQSSPTWQCDTVVGQDYYVQYGGLC